VGPPSALPRASLEATFTAETRVRFPWVTNDFNRLLSQRRRPLVDIRLAVPEVMGVVAPSWGPEPEQSIENRAERWPMVPRKGLARLATIPLISLMKSASHLRSVYQGRVPPCIACCHTWLKTFAAMTLLPPQATEALYRKPLENPPSRSPGNPRLGHPLSRQYRKYLISV